jgi:hypothetical protein
MIPMDAHKPDAIRAKYSASLMSDHKWKKFYLVMAEHGSDLCGIEYRFTDTSRLLTGTAPTKTQVWDTAIDDPVQQAGGPIEYRHIESLAIPRVHKYRLYENGPLVERNQNIAGFLVALEAVGQFPITETADHFILNAYKKA